MEFELKSQKDQYLRKSSTKAVPQTDPELEKMRSFIRQLEEEISDLRRQLEKGSEKLQSTRMRSQGISARNT
jgi:flagellar biosynthesis chaperone FliJ